MISIDQTNITVNFSRFDPEAYKVFLQSKRLPEYNLSYDWQKDSYVLKCPSRFAHVFGLQRPDIDRDFLPANQQLFDYQQWIIYTLALPAKRFAVWCDTGLGKAFMMLELARQVLHKTGGRVLMIVPLNLIQQTIDETDKFYGADYPEINILESRKALKEFCTGSGPGVGMINPEKFIPRKDDPETISECQWLSGALLDEASILKSGGGTIKWALIKSCRGIEYKYTFTATPAPNETMEYASQGSFLEKLRSEGEIIWTFFIRTKDGDWKIKENARDAFYRFLSGWSIYMRDPARYGFQDHLKDLPKPIHKEYKIGPTAEQLEFVRKMPDRTGQLTLIADSAGDKLEMTQRIKYSEIAKGFYYTEDSGAVPIRSFKPDFVAELVKQNLREGLKVLVWTVFDEESRILFEKIGNNGHKVDVLTGKLPKKDRIPIIENFRTGKTDCLITKAKLLGYGLNFQVCGSNVVSGFNDSEEQRYQLERRSYRYGQKKAVLMHYPYIPELEGIVYDNINRKRARTEEEVRIMENDYIKCFGDLKKCQK